MEKGKIESIFTPELGNQKGLSLTKWYFKPGDIIKSGDIVCEIENENITMEFESIYSGRILSTCKPKQKLTSGTEIFRIEGI
ncbi:biotin/lipoyl-containing protein [Maribacter luteus]|uniref:biotin/lipoyl-containing protein n=1 Tax=Maribacter luteus TaxID=2594478 RepID=UPI002493BD78|nr:biotin/lipoyl-containing protein [Maribacter luteus]